MNEWAEGWPSPIEELAARCTFPPAGSSLTCAVSGGADSMALMVLAIAAGCAVSAIHVEHGLREGSAAEADVVEQAAALLGASFISKTVSVPPGPNQEARARQARFGVLPDGVATGHTMDDQAETILLNLLRGSGADGLAGMEPGHSHPILGLRRAETHAVCAAMGLQPVMDPSNDDPAFLRNRVRHELLPLCADIAGRDPVPVLARQAGVLRDEVALLNALAQEATPDPSDAKAVAGLALPLARRSMRRWLQTSGGSPYPPSLAEVDRVLAVASGSAVATEISGGRRVSRSAGRLSIGAGGSDSVTPVTTEEAGATVPSWAQPEVGPVMVDAARVSARVAELGAQITADYADDPPLLVAVLKGAMLFMSDLCRAIALPVDVDFMAVSSYGSATKTSGVVRIVKDLDSELEGRHVVVVEDIIDSGLTLNYLRRYLHARQPKSVEVCALLVKEGEQRVELDLRYIGFTIPAAFVVGYGLDVAEKYRNLSGVHYYLGAEDDA
ncbi:MAG TPA: hypoxanthine phosphoribosyltransferase [Acidimicrobiales bacterium]|nr:hypoxanthine phosphoribosyltransferase [Acidimicrobiales bacterium]